MRLFEGTELSDGHAPQVIPVRYDAGGDRRRDQLPGVPCVQGGTAVDEHPDVYAYDDGDAADVQVHQEHALQSKDFVISMLLR